MNPYEPQRPWWAMYAFLACIIMLISMMLISITGCTRPNGPAAGTDPHPAVWCTVSCTRPGWQEKPDPIPLPEPNSRAYYMMFIDPDTPWDACD